MPPKKKKRTTRLPPPRCSMCRKFTSIKNSLVPGKCLKKHGFVAHRICKKCWFEGDRAFGTEGKSHQCPGCTKKLPLTDKRHVTTKPNTNAEVIELWYVIAKKMIVERYSKRKENARNTLTFVHYRNTTRTYWTNTSSCISVNRVHGRTDQTCNNQQS